MNAMKVGLLLISIVLCAIAGYWVGLHHQNQLQREIYEEKLVDTSNLILIVDAIDNESAKDVLPILKAQLERNFTQIISLYLKQGYQEGEYGRCVISRRVRSDYASGSLLSDYPDDILERVDSYLNSHCAGDPSSTNWVK